MLIKNIDINPSILSSANTKENADREGKFKYFAKKEFIPSYKYHILNTKKAFDLNKLVIFDFDFPMFNQNNPHFFEFQALPIVQEVLKLIHKEKICYSASPNGIKIYIVCKDETINDKLQKTYLASSSLKWNLQTSSGEIKEKECVIEVLHKLSHHCDFAFTNDDTNLYYQVFNSENLFKEYSLETLQGFFNVLFSLDVKSSSNLEAISQGLPKEEKDKLTFKKFHSFINMKTRKYRNKSIKAFIQELVKTPEKFYSYLLEFDLNSYEIKSGNASNAITKITPFFYHSDKETFFAFIEYIASNVYEGIRNCDFTYLDKIPDRVENQSFINEEGEEVLLIGEEGKEKVLIYRNEDNLIVKMNFAKVSSLIGYIKNNLKITLPQDFIDENINNRIITICEKNIEESFGKIKELDFEYRMKYAEHSHFYNAYTMIENSKKFNHKWKENPSSFQGKGLIDNYPKLKVLLENIFLDNPLEENLLIQAGHFVLGLKPQFANVFCDSGGTGKDFYQNLKSMIYGSTYLKSSHIANDFVTSKIDEKTLIYQAEFKTRKNELESFKDLITATKREVNIKNSQPRVIDCSNTMYEYSTNDILSINQKNFDFSMVRRINYIYSDNRKQLKKAFEEKGFKLMYVSIDELAEDLASLFYGIVYDYTGGEIEKFAEHFDKACDVLVENSIKTFNALAEEHTDSSLCEIIASSFEGVIAEEERSDILSILETFKLQDNLVYKAFQNREKYALWKDIKIVFDTISPAYLKSKEGKNLYFKITKKEKKLGTQRFNLSFA